ncbi:hypothetical protein KFE94_12225 [bacterium SCSIO 12643]|nr:hypothetical protein KFE94_12225 [bacterium SCSIO 12643]
MKKDIQIPEVKNVYVAAVNEVNEYDEQVWNVYIINDQNEMIEGVMVTSKGYLVQPGKQNTNTSVLRHVIGNIPAKTAAKIEPITPEVFHLNNEYWVTFFSGNQLMEKKYVFGAYTITEELMEYVPVLEKKAVVIW